MDLQVPSGYEAQWDDNDMLILVKIKRAIKRKTRSKNAKSNNNTRRIK